MRGLSAPRGPWKTICTPVRPPSAARRRSTVPTAGRDRPAVKRKLRAAWKLTNHKAATERLQALADDLAHAHPEPRHRSGRPSRRRSRCSASAFIRS